ncbi:hypothetical protein [Bradyrhizobium acaciae]|uniref:hypothetical protein n=1 Tax=Bradyrhizobium acaciae TaxID=2683706 RepID=UPI001E5A4006|nr:hypothetical protein [Bradyrhizobium acaciae]MCC8977606.1 hypothetical protein [Bradyrhizobium acaciae]
MKIISMTRFAPVMMLALFLGFWLSSENAVADDEPSGSATVSHPSDEAPVEFRDDGISFEPRPPDEHPNDWETLPPETANDPKEDPK